MTLHSHLPAVAGLTVGSTSCHRATPGGVDLGREGGEVACGVEVPVQDQAAGLAVVCRARTGPAWFSPRRSPSRSSRTDTSGRPRAAGRRSTRSCTPVGGGVSANPASAMCRASRRLREHPGHVEVFDHDRAVFAGEPGGELVQAVAAQVRDPGVRPGEPGRRALPPVRRPPAGAPVRAGPARQRAGRARRSRCCAASRWRGLGTSLAGGQHGEVLDADVDADHRVRAGPGCARRARPRR